MSSNKENPQLVKGQKVFASLKDGRSLEGIFSRQIEARKSIIFLNLSFIPDGKSLEQLELKLDQILHITCLEEGKSVVTHSDTHIGTNIESHSETNIESCPGDTKPDRSVLFDKIKESVEKYVFIDQTDEKFSGAIKAINDVDIIAVSGEGSEKGRFGHLSILAIATHKSIFLFDIVNLGEKAFLAGGRFFKKVLESKNMLKVVYNCTLFSDCLKHNYHINLLNVFDTQACHFMIVKNSCGHFPSSVHLSDLISEYLKLPGNLCDDQKIDPNVSCRRPVDDKVAGAAAWRVALLRKLKAPLDDALYAPFENMCQLYIASVRDVTDELEAKTIMHRHSKDGYPKDITSQLVKS